VPSGQPALLHGHHKFSAGYLKFQIPQISPSTRTVFSFRVLYSGDRLQHPSSYCLRPAYCQT
jgi:hypothetical protein